MPRSLRRRKPDRSDLRCGVIDENEPMPDPHRRGKLLDMIDKIVVPLEYPLLDTNAVHITNQLFSRAFLLPVRLA